MYRKIIAGAILFAVSALGAVGTVFAKPQLYKHNARQTKTEITMAQAQTVADEVKKKVDVDIVSNPERVFAHQTRKDWCAPAGVQMVLATLGLENTSDATQREIAGRVREWEAYSDSRNGEWGPAAMALALEAYGAKGYEVRAFDTMTHALRDAAVAIKKTKSPVVLLAWRGAHTWVMTGYRADADPAVFRDSKITGAYILDPWYPDVSSIWGPSNPPGFFTTMRELRENFLPWKRPEGKYPDRDGLYITVVPTKARAATG